MHILVVSHFSPEFEAETVEFYEYFKNQLNLSRHESHFYNWGAFLDGFSPEDILLKMAEVREPLVIYYGGHGYRNGWNLGDECYMPYEIITDTLKKRTKPTIFVNDCCFGMALQDYLHKLRCQSMLLGLAPKTLEGFDSLVPAVVSCWGNRHPADPKLWVYRKESLSPFVLEKCGLRLRYGAPLDYLCYPKSRRL
jgi:hypothetical protein